MADGNYLKFVRNEHTLANDLFPSPTCIPAEEEGKRARPLAQLMPFLLFPFPNTLSSHPRIILDFWIPIRFRGRGNTISCTFCWRRNWCYLSPIVLPTIRFGPDWGQEWRCASSCVPCPLNHLVAVQRQFERLFPLTGKIGSNFHALPKWESLWMYSQSYSGRK